MKLKSLLITLLCSIAVVGTINAEDEKNLEMEDVPEAVQETIELFISLLPEDSELEEFSMEHEAENVLYEAEIEVPGDIEYEVKINEEGKILEIEMEH